jgi:hypothetical protein
MKVIGELLVITFLEDMRSEAAHMVAMLEAGRDCYDIDLTVARRNLASIDRKLEILRSSAFDATQFYSDIFNITTAETQEKKAV